MDVRCDRCQTEYELDDESVAGAGASVQCTTCGHTFVVSRNGSISVGLTPPSGLGSAETTSTGPRPSQPSLSSAGPAVPEWVLATEAGQTHRLRDLTTLQKWVVERRVSRADRVSHRGGAWRALGDVEELRPFFDVVDQADRQTGAARAAVASPAVDPGRAGRATSPATPRRLQNAMRPHVSADLDDDDVLSGASSRGRRGRGGADSFLDADIGDDDDLSLAFKPRRTGLKIFGVLVFVGLAAGAAWFMFRDPHAFHLASGTPIPPAGAPPANGSSSAAAPAPVAPAAAAGARVDPTAAAVPAAPPAPPVKPAAQAPPPPPAAAPAPVAAAPVPAAPVAAAPPPEATRARSYEQLVDDADRALENGQTSKAQKLYEDALRLQPNGVAAMTGSAYVLLDKRHPLAAIGLFKQALSNAPHFAPALFGLGEAYRGEGEAAQAIDAYKRYLEQSPTGTDAPAARRQIKELGESGSASHDQGPSAVIPQGTRGEAPIAPPPVPAP
jgi:predicted Zn finger-like uncharacterized protein